MFETLPPLEKQRIMKNWKSGKIIKKHFGNIKNNKYGLQGDMNGQDDSDHVEFIIFLFSGERKS